MNNSQIADMFSRGYEKGKGSNLFIDGDTIYSYGYHFPIAKRTNQRYQGKEVYLFNSRGYSNSTSKHQSHVRSALMYDFLIVAELPRESIGSGTFEKDKAKKEIGERIKNNTGSMKRSRKYKDMYRLKIEHDIDQLKALELLELDMKKKPDDSSIVKTTAIIAKMGEFFGSTQKESNDWKARMLKAGLSNKGLIMPEDWDKLTEDEKQSRLDKVIQIASQNNQP